MTQAFLFLTRRSSSVFLARAFTTTTTSTIGRPSTSGVSSLLAKRARRPPSSSSSSSSSYRPKPYGSRRRFTSGISTVEDDLDAALDNLLGLGSPSTKPADSGTNIRVVHSNTNNYNDYSNKEDSSKGVVSTVDFNNEDVRATNNTHWTEIGIDPRVIDVLSEKGITHFTPVQAQVFEPIIARRDVIGRSRTGTGKTLAFGLGGMTRLVKLLEETGKRDPTTGRNMPGRKVSMLILCPTRELARQVEEELALIAKPMGLTTTVVHGGVSYGPQCQTIQQGLDVLVGTPGRIIDLMERGDLSLGEVDVVVLDEADEMLNMGFADDVEHILESAGTHNPRKPQCLLFSATTPSWVKGIARRYQQDVLTIDSTGDEGGARVAQTVRHLAIQVPPGIDAKKAVLEDIIAVHIYKEPHVEDMERLKNNPIAAAAVARKLKSSGTLQQKIFGKTIVFTKTKREADELVGGGVFKSLTAQALHGDVGQKSRDAILNAFRAGSFNVLCATDVASRGIDVSEVDLVVQLDPPEDVDSYVHRSGRTGRAGKKGVSVLLFNPQQARAIARIEQDLGHGFQFELIGPPSAEAALKAAARTSALACAGISEDTAKYFREAAAELLSNTDNPEDIVARCLAAISRRSTEIKARSLMTGEPGMVTVEMVKSGQPDITTGDVVYAVASLARESRQSGENPFDGEIGKVMIDSANGRALFDMAVEEAKKLIEYSKTAGDGAAQFALVEKIELDRNSMFAGHVDGGRRGGRGQSRGSSGGRSQSFRSERGSYSQGSFSSSQGWGHRPERDHHGHGPRSSFHRDENSRDFRGGDRDVFTSRYDSSPRGNSGW